MAETECECWWTPPETWLSAASCGYGSGYEPGSTMEWNPDCPVHRPYDADTPTHPAPTSTGAGTTRGAQGRAGGEV